MTPRTLGRALIRHPWWKLASIVLAVLLWVALLGEPELVTIQTVPVLYRNLSPSLLLLSDATASVQLELRGPSRKLTRGGAAPSLSSVRPVRNPVDHEGSFVSSRSASHGVTQMMSLNTAVLLSVSLATGKLKPHLGHGSANVLSSAVIS